MRTIDLTVILVVAVCSTYHEIFQQKILHRSMKHKGTEFTQSNCFAQNLNIQ